MQESTQKKPSNVRSNLRTLVCIGAKDNHEDVGDTGCTMIIVSSIKQEEGEQADNEGCYWGHYLPIS